MLLNNYEQRGTGFTSIFCPMHHMKPVAEVRKRCMKKVQERNKLPSKMELLSLAGCRKLC